jgi:hypothetical protein
MRIWCIKIGILWILLLTTWKISVADFTKNLCKLWMSVTSLNLNIHKQSIHQYHTNIALLWGRSTRNIDFIEMHIDRARRARSICFSVKLIFLMDWTDFRKSYICYIIFLVTNIWVILNKKNSHSPPKRSKKKKNLKKKLKHVLFYIYILCLFLIMIKVTRVAQWLELRVQRSDDPCVGGSNPTVGRGCRSFGWDRINWGPVSQ